MQVQEVHVTDTPVDMTGPAHKRFFLLPPFSCESALTHMGIFLQSNIVNINDSIRGARGVDNDEDDDAIDNGGPRASTIEARTTATLVSKAATTTMVVKGTATAAATTKKETC